ncbi:hypothetical protein, partial [Pseudomonas sp. 2995-1]|uniref:hypothetical protein n=1 Tax=Pseudomonas sp. 2995-1 TaxID=1712679 RepID=UPI001C491A22
QDAAKRTGLVYLIEYSPEKFESIQAAKKDLEKTLTELGFNVRYVSENFVVELLETEATSDTGEDIITPFMHSNQEWHY